MLESKFQSQLIKDIKKQFPGCVVLKNDANYIPGFPDLTILYKNKWAVLECKASAKSKCQPNQEYYIEQLNNMSYSKKVYPENVKEVLHELQSTLQP